MRGQKRKENRNQPINNLGNQFRLKIWTKPKQKANGQTYILVPLHDLPGGWEDDRSRVQVTDVAAVGPHLTKGSQLKGNYMNLHGSYRLFLFTGS